MSGRTEGDLGPFQRADTNGDGRLSPEELRGALGELGLPTTAAYVQMMLDIADSDGNGSLDTVSSSSSSAPSSETERTCARPSDVRAAAAVSCRTRKRCGSGQLVTFDERQIINTCRREGEPPTTRNTTTITAAAAATAAIMATATAEVVTDTTSGAAGPRGGLRRGRTPRVRRSVHGLSRVPIHDEE